LRNELVATIPPKEPRLPTAGVPWFGLVCIALAIFIAWLVVQLSPQKSLFVAGPALRLSQLRLPETFQFLEGRGFVVIVSVVLALLVWVMFRQPRSR
jgi:hypothetical protein